MCFRLGKCCFCTDVNTGSRIIAIVGIVLAVLAILSNIASITAPGLITGIFGIAINACLYYGAHAEKAIFVLIWLILQLIEVVLLAIATVGFVLAVIFGYDILGTGAHQEGTLWAAIVSGVLMCIILALYIYFWAVAYSCYKDIKEKMNRGAGVV